ncbi:transcription factor Zip1 [Schizosaccharomyces japonicus yFS275]|uniref:Transcription factor Zip1 n=1 Tax=Schizosaccharomyces japonicus (strain yFS275 / FY16936) TaxID=402676 RepID=B6K7N3_SCHJY|nr:transcription factor Zip1 [Schizosaccharomyces japonicus yFS275]EEB09537.1 transcription factor Zip1 [Schizosaccharomyces japonicus yFS275]
MSDFTPDSAIENLNVTFEDSPTFDDFLNEDVKKQLDLFTNTSFLDFEVCGILPTNVYRSMESSASSLNDTNNVKPLPVQDSSNNQNKNTNTSTSVHGSVVKEEEQLTPPSATRNPSAASLGFLDLPNLFPVSATNETSLKPQSLQQQQSYLTSNPLTSNSSASVPAVAPAAPQMTGDVNNLIFDPASLIPSSVDPVSQQQQQQQQPSQAQQPYHSLSAAVAAPEAASSRIAAPTLPTAVPLDQQKQQQSTDTTAIVNSVIDKAALEAATDAALAAAAANPSKTRRSSTSTPARTAAEEDKRRRNTAASARFRIKKKLKEQQLERSVKELSEKVVALQARLRELEMENNWLKSLIRPATTNI